MDWELFVVAERDLVGICQLKWRSECIISNTVDMGGELSLVST